MTYRQVLRYCPHTIQLLRGPSGVAGVGLDKYGTPLEGATPGSLTLRARVEFDNLRIINDKGEEVVCAGRVFIPPTYAEPDTGLDTELTIGPEDRIVFEGKTYAVERRNRQEGWTGDRGRHWDVAIR